MVGAAADGCSPSDVVSSLREKTVLLLEFFLKDMVLNFVLWHAHSRGRERENFISNFFTHSLSHRRP